MIDSTAVRVRGPLAPYRDGFWTALAAQGYTPLSSANQLRVMAHFSCWLEERRLRLEDLDARRVEQFLRHRRRLGRAHWRSLRGLEPFLGHLWRVGAIPKFERDVGPRTSFDALLQRYEQYLRQERAFEFATARGYLRTVREFLSRCSAAKAGAVGDIRHTDVTSFVLRAARSSSIGSAKLKVTVLRSFFRYLYVRGDVPRDLTLALPSVAGWRLAGLPKFLAPSEVGKLLRSCDRRTRVGRRDFAAMLLMVRLGLRAGEVAALRLEDIDWIRGELTVRGKARSEDRLPLPRDVGQAVANYVEHARPRIDCRYVFLRARAPLGPLGRPAMTAMVQLAGARAGVAKASAHRLRHSAATQMLRSGASLSAVAHVLRHRHLDTTAIYAKVDRTRLRSVGRPWLGAAQ